MTIVHIDWVDSVGQLGIWQDRNSALRELNEDSMRHHSVGFLVKEEKNYIVIAQSYDEEGLNLGNIMQVPRAAITKIRKLKL